MTQKQNTGDVPDTWSASPDFIPRPRDGEIDVCLYLKRDGDTFLYDVECRAIFEYWPDDDRIEYSLRGFRFESDAGKSVTITKGDPLWGDLCAAYEADEADYSDDIHDKYADGLNLNRYDAQGERVF